MYNEVLIIERLKKGEAQALAELMKQYQNYVYTILNQMLYTHEAKEAAQDSFLKVYKNINSFNSQSKFSTWLYSIVYRTGLDYIKKRKRTDDLGHHQNDKAMSVNAGAYRGLEQEECGQLVERLLNQLKSEDAAILRMFYLEELSLKEICTITSLTESNLKVKLFRSRKLLKEMALNEQAFQLSDYIN
jgi:RNA polymerase sigma-70 factor (ECF subfamily)